MIQFKTLHRAFLTFQPTGVTVYIDTSDLCWGGCGKKGNLEYILYDIAQLVKYFWFHSFSQLLQIIKCLLSSCSGHTVC